MSSAAIILYTIQTTALERSFGFALLTLLIEDEHDAVRRELGDTERVCVADVRRLRTSKWVHMGF